MSEWKRFYMPDVANLKCLRQMKQVKLRFMEKVTLEKLAQIVSYVDSKDRVINLMSKEII